MTDAVRRLVAAVTEAEVLAAFRAGAGPLFGGPEIRRFEGTTAKGFSVRFGPYEAVWAAAPEDPSTLEALAILTDEALARVDRSAQLGVVGSTAMVRALVESTSDPVWVLNRSLRLTAFNCAFATMMRASFGMHVEIGSSIDGLPEPHRTNHRAGYEAVLAGGAVRFDWSTPERDRVFDVVAHPIESGEHRVGIAVYCRDVTAKRHATAELERAKVSAERANRAKSDFLAQMSHEIRTPLNAIVGLTELLHTRDLPAEDAHLIQKVRSNSNALLHLVSGILDFSRIEAGEITIEPKPIDLGRTVGDAVDMLRDRAEDRGLLLEVYVETGIPQRVRADPHRLRQVVVNLVENAIKYTEAGRVEVQLGFHDGCMEFVVRDTGRGISEGEQLKIFERFQRADATASVAGTGLGLAITRSLVNRMGGQIHIESEVGVGSIFHVSIPLEVVGGVRQTHAVRRLHRRLRIVVVDDSADNRLVTAALLRRVGHQVVELDGGDALLAQPLDDVDLVLTDLHMPGIGGLDAVRILRERGDETPVVALSGHATDVVAQACREAGMSGFLPKPTPAATLEEEVQRFAGPPRFLVVDDAPVNRMLLRLWLNQLGAEVVEAHSVVSATMALKHRLDGVFLDYELSDGRGSDVPVGSLPVVGVSGRSASELRDRWPQLSHVLCKPIERAQMDELAAKLLAERFADDGGGGSDAGDPQLVHCPGRTDV